MAERREVWLKVRTTPDRARALAGEGRGGRLVTVCTRAPRTCADANVDRREHRCGAPAQSRAGPDRRELKSDRTLGEHAQIGGRGGRSHCALGRDLA